MSVVGRIKGTIVEPDPQVASSCDRPPCDPLCYRARIIGMVLWLKVLYEAVKIGERRGLEMEDGGA
jgi:hypothetical protein